MRKIQTSLHVLVLYVCLLAGGPFTDNSFAQPHEEWAAKIVSVEGSVKIRHAGETQWVAARLNDVFSPGDMIRVEENSRATVFLPNETILRLDQKTTLTLSRKEEEQNTPMIDLLKGVVHFFSREHRGLEVTTPFVDGTVEGTEFLVEVDENQTFFHVFKGKVATTNNWGGLVITGGQSAMSGLGQAPAPYTLLRPGDAVQWALYYPPVIDYRPEIFSDSHLGNWQVKVRESLRYYWQGDLAQAFFSLAGEPGPIDDERFFIYRAALLLSVGRVEMARDDICKALVIDSSNSHAYSLQSIIAMVQNEKELSLELAQRASAADPQSSTAKVAMSYAQQAMFALRGALDSLQQAVTLNPANPLAWARMAELWQAMGYLDRSLEAAEKAAVLNPKLARTQMVLGFAYLAQIKTKDSKHAFEKAIALDSAMPLSRLGLGLAKIREGDLKEGRRDIEIAASLDPNNSLIRSYLGKAYHEEKRDDLAADQLSAAKKLDSKDPSAWFYDAIRKQTTNRPVEALHDLQKSIELNDNRAVYRSRLMLDEDLAARSASLGRIYQDLGFEQLALVEGWKSVNTNPANYSAHRFLSDTYAALPRHEIARVSERLQSQLLQPININPVQPSLLESNLFIVEGAGSQDSSYYEFTPLFHRNRLALQASSVVGGNGTLGGEIVQSGVWERVSYSLGGLVFRTDGVRENNDLEQDLLNAFMQISLTYKMSFQGEFRYKDTENGDLSRNFDRNNFVPDLRENDSISTVRLGLHHAFDPRSEVIASAVYAHGDFNTLSENFLEFEVENKEESYMVEAQHLLHIERFSLCNGVGHINRDRKETIDDYFFLETTTQDIESKHTNIYSYALINYPEAVTWTLGGSVDFLESDFVDKDRFNPKVGVIWQPFALTTIRASMFSCLARSLISSQTIEPTQVAGFNQFFDDPDGTESWRYGIAVDQEFSKAVFGGVEFSKRDLKVPYKSLSTPPPYSIFNTDWEENVVRAYLYWAPQSWVATSGEIFYEHFERDPQFGSPGNLSDLTTWRFKPAVNFFHPSGLTAQLETNYVEQEGEFGNPMSGFTPQNERFWIVNASLGYRMPKRYGLITLEAKNILNEQFNFYEEESAMPWITNDRMIYLKVTLSI